MSTPPITKTESSRDRVMVRAHMGEPVILTAVGAEAGSIRVFGSDPDKVIGFPAADAFTLDDRLFRQLSDVYTAGDQHALAELWATAEPFEARLEGRPEPDADEGQKDRAPD